MTTNCTLTAIATWREIHDDYVEKSYEPPQDMIDDKSLTPRQVRTWTEARREHFDKALTEILAPYGCKRISEHIFRDHTATNQPNGAPLEKWNLEAVRTAVEAINYEKPDRNYSDPAAAQYIGPGEDPAIDEPEGFLTTVSWLEDGEPVVTATRISTNPTAGPRWLIGVKVNETWFNDGVYEWSRITQRAAGSNLHVARPALSDEELRR